MTLLRAFAAAGLLAIGLPATAQQSVVQQSASAQMRGGGMPPGGGGRQAPKEEPKGPTPEALTGTRGSAAAGETVAAI